MRKIFLATLCAALAAPAAAQTKLDFILNWVPGGDHAPYYFAKAQGWYAKEGLDVNLEPGKGSMLAVQKVGAGANPIGLADMGNVLIAKGKGANTVGVFNVYANSPQGLYWLKSSGIKGIKDFAGKKIGNPAADGARPMWPALAKANGVDPKSVIWVNVDANAKLSALKAKSIDVTTSFYNIHHIFQRELGDDMGFVAWRDVGLNPYGNSVVVNADFLAKNKPAIDEVRQGDAARLRHLRQGSQALRAGAGGRQRRAQVRQRNDQLEPGRGADERQVLEIRRARHPRRRPHEGGLRAGARLRRHRQALRREDRLHQRIPRPLGQDDQMRR